MCILYGQSRVNRLGIQLRLQAIQAVTSVLIMFCLLGATIVSSYSDEMGKGTAHIGICNRIIPSTGTWSDIPPHWTPKGCHLVPFGINATRHCMRNRTLYVIGNSVPRQMAFGLLELLGGAHIKREGQRDMCPKNEGTWGDSCHSEFAGVKIKYLFLQFMDGFDYRDRGGFRYLINSSHYPNLPNNPQEALNGLKTNAKFLQEDHCIHTKTRSCLKKFFNGSTSRDVLIFSLGMSYANQMLMPSVDHRRWLISSASAFRSHVTATFHGVVFRFTNAQLLGSVRSYGHTNTQNMKEVDEWLWDIWSPDSIDETEAWHTIDQWEINRDRDYLYNDHVHFIGPLTAATLHQVLNALCPGQGDHLIGSIICVKAERTQNGQNQLVSVDTYIVDNVGSLRRFVANSSCLPVIQFTGKQELSHAELASLALTKGDDVIDVCSDGKLIKGSGSRECYVMDNGRRRSFPNSNVFLKLGYDFDNVVTISDWQLHSIPLGPPIV